MTINKVARLSLFFALFMAGIAWLAMSHGEPTLVNTPIHRHGLFSNPFNMDLFTFGDWLSTYCVTLVFLAALFFGLPFFAYATRKRAPLPQRTYNCFLCDRPTSRKDGYCSDAHRSEDLRTAAYRYGNRLEGR